MKAYSVSLRSGSSGNSTFVRSGAAAFAVDCGLNGRQFVQALQAVGESVADLDAILVTHEHSDHSCGLGVLMRRHRIPLYLTEKTYEALRPELDPFDESLIHLIEAGKTFTIKGTSVLPFSTPHDAVDSVGFRFETPMGAVGIATDLGHFSQEVREALAGCGVVHLEANYDADLLETGRYPRFLKRRIAGPRGHLSNEEAAFAASWLIREGTRVLVLSHLSEENNEPDLAQRAVSSYLASEGAREGRDYALHVSPRYHCSCLFLPNDPLTPMKVEAATGSGEQLSLFDDRPAAPRGRFS